MDCGLSTLRVAVVILLTCSGTFGQMPSHAEDPRPATPSSGQEKNEDQERKQQKLDGQEELFEAIHLGDGAQQKDAAPLNSTQKLHLFVRAGTDPFGFVTPLIATGFSEALLDNSGFGWRAAGLAKHYGAALADQTSAQLFGVWVFPSLLHQDPRYYPLKTGSFRQRLQYSLSRVAITRSDAGHSQLNYSLTMAALVSSSISNSYYPETQRGVGHTFSLTAITLGVEAGFDVMREFFPEIKRAMHKQSTESAAGQTSP